MPKQNTKTNANNSKKNSEEDVVLDNDAVTPLTRARFEGYRKVFAFIFLIANVNLWIYTDRLDLTKVEIAVAFLGMLGFIFAAYAMGSGVEHIGKGIGNRVRTLLGRGGK